MQSEQLHRQSNNNNQGNDKQLISQNPVLLPETAIRVKDFRSLVKNSTHSYGDLNSK